MTFIPFAPWEPDKALFGGSHAPEAFGVIPSASGYVPLPSLLAEPGLPVLPGTFRGGISFHDTAGNPLTVAGTDNALYLLSDQNWRLLKSGCTCGSGGWDFARYGNTLIAVNGVDTPLYATVGLASLADFSPIEGAPVGNSVEVVREFVMIGGVETTKVRWSAIGNPLDWPTPGSNDAQYKQADEQDFPDTGSAVAVAGALTGTDVVIFTERAIHLGRYSGTPYIFQFDILDKGRGTIAPRSVITGNNAVYFLSEEGFFATNGASVGNIGFERVNNWFRATADDIRRHETRGAADPVTGVIYWSFAGRHAPEGVHDQILIYHPQLDRWSCAQTATLGILPGLSRGRTLEQLDPLGPLDSLPYSLDSRAWKGGVPGLAAFTPENYLAWFSGPPSDAFIDTAESGGKRMLIHGARPLVDGAQARASILCRDFLSQPPTAHDCAPVSPRDGIAYTHISTRYARARIHIPQGQNWLFALGCELAAEPEGDV